MSTIVPLPLLPDRISNDTVECLTILLREARRGNLSGIGFVGYVRGGFVANSAGDAYNNPTHTRGMLLALSDKLSLRIDGGNL